MQRLLIVIFLFGSEGANAQEKIPFVPFVIDELKYEQVDQTMARVSMPRDAHIAFQQLWQALEKQAIESAKIRPSK